MRKILALALSAVLSLSAVALAQVDFTCDVTGFSAPVAPDGFDNVQGSEAYPDQSPPFSEGHTELDLGSISATAYVKVTCDTKDYYTSQCKFCYRTQLYKDWNWNNSTQSNGGTPDWRPFTTNTYNNLQPTWTGEMTASCGGYTVKQFNTYCEHLEAGNYKFEIKYGNKDDLGACNWSWSHSYTAVVLPYTP